MAIKKSFASKNFRKPGAYSRSKVDNSSGAAIAANDTLFLVGESNFGAPGATEGITEFSAAQINQAIEKYGNGPLVDCILAALRPSKTPNVSGAGRFLIYKTNASTQASYTAQNSTPANLIVFKDKKWGVDGNQLSITIANGSTANQKIITINKLNSTAEVLNENPANAVLTIDYTGNASTAALTISGASKTAKTLTTTLAGDQLDGSLNLSITLNNYTMKQLVDYINAQTGYAATLVTNSSSAKKGIELDSVTALNILTVKSLYRLQEELIEIINEESDRVEATLSTTPVIGVPANITNQFLTGGAKGASTNSNFSTAFSKSLAEEYNVLLACISRDASEDIADAIDGFTDAASTYTIAAVLAAQEAHLRLRSDVTSRKEAQGFGGVRKSTKAAAYTAISTVASELMQVVMQDVYVLNEQAELAWKHPHVMAALCCGIRLGTEVGEPMTFKTINANAIGHFVNSETGLEAGDFNTDLDSDDAIDNGVLYAEKNGSAFRIVVDNTTYGADQSFVYNRGSVMEAAQFVAKDLRGLAESIFVGNKTSNGVASSIKSILRARLIELNSDAVNIITGSLDAPQGFVEETFVVTVTGNTANVQVEIKPVQGLEFIFIDFTLGDIQQAA